MKTLYFIGNEELWNDAWFKALVESLEKKLNLSLFLYDSSKDIQKIKAISSKLTVADRLVVKKEISINFGLDKKHESLVYFLSKEKSNLKNSNMIEWGVSTEILLEKLGLSEASQVIEDDFLSELDIASEVSKVIESEQKSTLDNDALSSSTEEDISKLLEADFSSVAQEAPSSDQDKLLEAALESNPGVKKSEDKDNQQVLESAEPELSLEGLGDLSQELENNLEIPKESEVPSSEEKPAELESQDLLNALGDLSAIEEKVVKEEKVQEKDEVQIPDSLELADVAPVPNEPELNVLNENIKPEVEVGKLLSSMSAEVSSEDLDVIKRYSNIKERELRESQASAEALRRQIRYFDERLKKSEEERRKLILKIEELQSELRTTSDKKEENRAQLKNIENHYEEKIKELQIQLESSQFQAGKLEKKLEDFRDRVRNDLQKIRSRERELASRLEIQKRDAEALLSAKDERLLNQKRDIDRLEFEIDKLRERLIDDINRSEERRKRITRALQSLKLAQSVLSGLDEESLEKEEKSKAA